MIDLVVAGGGPAGLVTALYAARAGLEAVVLDARTGPIDKACGEGLMPGAVAALTDLGVDLAGQPFHGIRYTDGRNTTQTRFAHGPGMGVRRTALHQALSDAVRAAGVRLEQIRVDEIEQTADSVTVGGVTARYAAIADGLHSPLRHALGLDQPTGARPRWGTRQHFAIAPWTDLVEVHWAANSEAYVTPVGPELVGVAVLSSTRAPYAEQLTQFPALVARLGPVAVTSVRGAGPFPQRSRARVAGRALLVGDAAGYVDALTGEGIAVSIACARALVDCVAADDPAGYERRWRIASRRYRLLTSGLLWARRRPPLASRIVPAAAHVPGVFGLAVRQLAG